MKINEECIREILKYLVENLSLKLDGDLRFSYKDISVLQLIKQLEPVGYTKEDIAYSVNILSEQYYIEGRQLQDRIKVSFAFQEIINVTYKGHKFYEAIKSDTTWNKTKGVIGKVGNHALDFIETTAQMVAVESAKQAVTIAMMSK